MVQVGLSAFTDYAPNDSVLVEDQNNKLTFRFDLDEPAPTGGLTVYLDSSLPFSLFNFVLNPDAFDPANSENLELGGAEPAFPDDEFPASNDSNTGFAVTIREGATFGTLALQIFDGEEPDPFGPAGTFDGLRNVTYTLKTKDQIDPVELNAVEAGNGNGVDIYTIDPNATSTGSITLVDTASQLNFGGPKISISATPSIVAESEGTALTLNFTVEEGTIPAEGLPIQLQVDNPNNPNNFWFLDFLSGELEADFYEVEGTGVNLLEVDSAGNPDPGSGKFGFLPPPFNGPINLVLTDANASLTFPIFDDNIPEPNEQVSFTLLDGAGYDLGTSATTAVTLQDSPAGTVNPSDAPKVSISASPTVLLEEEQTEYTITIDVDSDIPISETNPLDVIINTGIPNAVGEFAVGRPKVDTDGDGIGDTRFVTGVATTGLADPFTVDGVTGSFSLQPTEIGDGFFATLVDNTATITLKVADDGLVERTEFFTYSLVDGENYEVDPNAGSYDLTIPFSGELPKVSFSTDITTLSESDESVVTFNFSVDGDIPLDGLPISLDVAGDETNWFLDFSNASRLRFDPEIDDFNAVFLVNNAVGIDGPSFGPITVPDTISPPYDTIDLVLTDNQASFQLQIFDDLAAETNEDLSFTLEDGLDYTSSTPDPVTLTLQDSPSGTVNPSDAPKVSLSVSPEVLIESEETEYTITINVDGTIPTEGLDLAIVTGVPFATTEFKVDGLFVDTDNDGNPDSRFLSGIATTGLADPFTVDGVTGSLSLLANEFVDGFFATVVDNTATITLRVEEDGIDEGTEIFTYSLVDGENYEVDTNAGSYTLRIEDVPLNKILGTNGDDNLVGTGANDLIHGLKGNDRILGENGNDILEGNQGDDRLLGGKGKDSLLGGKGQDTLLGEEGDDTLEGDNGNDRLLGEGGKDVLNGGNGNDTILGGNLQDILSGGKGKDVLFGDAGSDTLEGGKGNDRLRGGDNGDLLFGGSGKDTILGEAGKDILSGDEGTDRLLGGDGSDSIFGGKGQDTLLGDAGNDLLSGDAGNDRILGGDGKDSLMGVTGNDTLIGGADKDTFVFGNGDGTDTIVDFEDGTDKIGLVNGELTFSDLTISRIGANLVLDVTGTGETLALIRDVGANITLTGADFTGVDDISSINDVL